MKKFVPLGVLLAVLASALIGSPKAANGQSAFALQVLSENSRAGTMKSNAWRY